MKIFTIYDSKAEAYMQPSFAHTRGKFLQSLGDVLADENHHLAKHSEDYVAFEVGEWDEQTGTLSVLDAKISLGVLIELKK